jgi:hypothetical protein
MFSPRASKVSALGAVAAVAMLVVAATRAGAAPVTFLVTMSGAQVVPPASNGYSGFGQLAYDADSGSLNYNIVLIGVPPQQVTGVELRQGLVGSNGAPVVQLAGGGFVQTSGQSTLTEAQGLLLLTGQLYVEVRGASGPLIRGQVLAPATTGSFPTITIPTLVAALATETPVPAQRQAVTGTILPPNTGNAGLRQGVQFSSR